jgi:catalase-peroxidase
LADLIVLAGNAGVEAAAKAAGHDVIVPFTPGRTDASQEWTDIESFSILEPAADGFRNYQRASYSVPAEALLIDKAQLLTLTAPELTVLVGGLRAININFNDSAQRPGTCSRVETAHPAKSSGRPPASTWCSARTPYSGL